MNVNEKIIGPSSAIKMLSNNPNNRKLNRTRVDKYAQEMRDGLWKTNGDTIRIGADGQLLDGQHRLQAIIDSGLHLPFLVVDNLPNDSMPTIDTGMPRKSSQVLEIRGEKNSVALVSVIRTVYKLKSTEKLAKPFLSTQQIIDLIEKYTGIREAVSEVMAYKKDALSAVSILGAVYYEGKQKDQNLAARFLKMVATGVEIDEGSPIKLLRERLLNNVKSKLKMTPNEILALHIKAWNALRSGNIMKQLYWSPANHHFPEME